MRVKTAIALSVALTLGTAQFASAADMPARGPIYKAPHAMPFSWSGCYVGAQVGYAWVRDRMIEIDQATGTISAFSPTDASEPSGVKVGGMAGCNWQWSANWVVGVEGDGEWTDIRGSVVGLPNTGTPADTFESRVDWQASIRARLGYATGRTLWYVTGGAAFAEIRHIYAVPFTGEAQEFSKTQAGWTVGGGIEHALMHPGWTVRIEYRYSDFGRITNVPNLPLGNWTTFTEHHDITEHAIRVGATYRFASGMHR